MFIFLFSKEIQLFIASFYEFLILFKKELDEKSAKSSNCFYSINQILRQSLVSAQN